MKTTVELSFSFEDIKISKALYDSLKPDNVNFPAGFDMSMKSSEREILISLSSTSRIDTLISTVDNVIEACQISLNGIRSSER